MPQTCFAGPVGRVRDFRKIAGNPVKNKKIAKILQCAAWFCIAVAVTGTVLLLAAKGLMP
jgi:hypothetical protein